MELGRKIRNPPSTASHGLGGIGIRTVIILRSYPLTYNHQGSLCFQAVQKPNRVAGPRRREFVMPSRAEPLRKTVSGVFYGSVGAVLPRRTDAAGFEPSTDPTKHLAGAEFAPLMTEANG